MTRTIAIAGAVVLALILGGTVFALTDMGQRLLGLSNGDDRFAACREGTVAGGDLLGGPFELQDAQGRTVTDADVITEPSLVYFGYTYCPDVCPLDMARNAEAAEILEGEGRAVQPVLISIDPQRDTPDAVGDYASNLSPLAVGLTGSPEQVKAAAQSYRVYYKSHSAGPEDEDYLVDHSTFTYLVVPGEGFVDYFRQAVSPDEMASRVGCYLEALG